VVKIDEASTSNMTTRIFRLTLSKKYLLIVLLAYLLLVTLASFLANAISPVAGLVLFFIILFSLIGLAGISADQNQRNVWIAIGLAPLIRIISLALPVISQLSQYVWYMVISIPILIAVISIMRALRYTPDDVGLNTDKPVTQFLMLIGAIILGVAGYYFLRTTAWTTYFSAQSTLFPALVLIIFTGFLEELVFRGVIQRTLDGLGSFYWIYGSAVYAVLQIGQGSIANCVFALVLSLYFGIAVKYTRSIIGVSLGHGLINVGLFLVLPHVLTF
jgi:membrane protease YdiL (CAAX protease family)